MLPSYQELMKPVLEAAKSGEIKLSNVIDLLAEQFNLSKDERTELLPSGRQAAFTNRVGWAKTYLAKAGLLDSSRRGHFVITDLGKEALNSAKRSITNTFNVLMTSTRSLSKKMGIQVKPKR
ncbi:hypothetical protein VCRA2119O48_90105 [Vibrio crassostreae]|nr:hypothetical protein VCRA2119O48_90105 [Vibrio crassostreae]CAK4026717.1 hypothetical protein VCRA212O16_80074 [Vibrio crassostreae]